MPTEVKDDDTLKAQMIFAFGARRSGTHWLQRVLSAHPDVASIPPETHLFSHGIAPLWERFHHGALNSPGVATMYVDRERLIRATRAFCDAVFAQYQRPDLPYLCERTPVHVGCADLLATVYPDARLVHIVRDGRDVARSIVSQVWGPSAFEDAVVEWRDSVSAGRRAARLADHYVEVRYEDLLAGGQEALGDLYRRIGLRVDEELLTDAAREAQVRRNVDPSGTGGGVGAEKWRTHLEPAQLAVFEEVAGELSRSLGYEPSPPSAAPRRPRRPSRPRRPAPPAPAGDDVGSRIQNALKTGQTAVDALMTGLLAGAPDEDLPAISDELVVRVVGEDGEQSRRGPEALDLLRKTVEADAAFRGRQVRGDVHPGLPTFTLLLAFALPDGRVAQRMLAVAVRDGLIRAVHVYRLADQSAPALADAS